MKRFDYISNTLGGSGNQYYFTSDRNDMRTSRVFYRITAGGRYNYALMFSNIIDSTFSDGSRSCKNLLCEEWEIDSLKASVCKKSDFGDGYLAMPRNIGELRAITFDGEHKKTVKSGEVFFTDEFEADADGGDYLCIEMTFSGTMMPCHEESLLPIFRKTEEGWVHDRNMPLPSLVGCDRKVKARIGFAGDSITQGIGTQPNSYRHWNALIAEKLGNEYAYWNLGLGFGRAEDMASDRIWMKKTMENDIVFVCFGVNDLLQGISPEKIKGDLRFIAEKLLNAGKKVIFQTLPPFDYRGDYTTKWENINRFIIEELSDKVDYVFDVVPILGKDGERHMAKYGGHPDEIGCAVWAEELYSSIKKAGIL